MTLTVLSRDSRLADSVVPLKTTARLGLPVVAATLRNPVAMDSADISTATAAATPTTMTIDVPILAGMLRRPSQVTARNSPAVLILSSLAPQRC